jgi:sulfoxide reductase heme-binding subunit YedZ
MRKWSPLQKAVHFLAWLPLIVLAVAYFTGNLTINPVQAAQQRTGDIAIILLLLSLACTPLNTLFGLPGLLKLRRPLGLYAFFYAGVHLLVYAGWDYSFNFTQASATLTEKRYLLAGIAALFILSLLALTSHNFWKVKMGKRWKKLHRLVYLAAGLVVLHVAWAIKGDVTRLSGDIWKPLAAGSVLALFLLARIPPIRKFLSGIRHKYTRRSSAAGHPPAGQGISLKDL